MYIFIWAESFIILESGSLLYICIRVEVLTNLSLSSAPPTITMLLSALSFSLKSSMPSMELCSVFWPTTNNTGVFMSKSGSSTSCKPVSCLSSMETSVTRGCKTTSSYPSRPICCKKGKAQTDHSSQILHKRHLKEIRKTLFFVSFIF